MNWLRLIGYWFRAFTHSIVSAVRAEFTPDARRIRQQLIGEWNAEAVEQQDGRMLHAETWIFRPDGTARYIPRSPTRFAVEFRYRLFRQQGLMRLQLVRSGFVAREAALELVSEDQLRLQWQNRNPQFGRVGSRSALFQRTLTPCGSFRSPD